MWVHTFSSKLLLTVAPFYHYNRANYEGSPTDFPTSTTQDRGSTYGGGQVSFSANVAKNDLQAGLYSFYQHDNELFGVIFNDGSGNQPFTDTEHRSGTLVCCIYGMWRLSARASERHYGWPAVWRVASVIAALRISALWLGQAGLSRPDWLQVPAYFALMLGLPEIYIIRGTRTAPLRWAMLGSVILAATSLLWASAFLWVANRLRLKGRRCMS